MSSLTATVLYVEDDADDVFFLRRALRLQNIKCNLQAVSNGQAARAYLLGEGSYQDRERFPLPAMIVTDLTIPGVEESSLQLISWIRSRPQFAGIPIICATGNDNPQMLEQFSRVGVVCHEKTSQMTNIAQAIVAVLGKQGMAQVG